MDLSDEAVKEFQEIYKKKCGEISFEKARIEAENFLNLFALISKPNKKMNSTNRNVSDIF